MYFNYFKGIGVTSRYRLGDIRIMLRTVLIGSCVSVQGTFVKALANGQIAVRVGNKVFACRPVAAKAA